MLKALKEINLEEGFKIKIFDDELTLDTFEGTSDIFIMANFGRQGLREEGKDHGDCLRIAKDQKMHIFAVRAYIHSGEAYSLVFDDWKEKDKRPFPPVSSVSGQMSDRFDSGWQGYLLVSKKEYPKREAAYEAAKGILEDYQAYVNGEGYMWEYEDPEGNSLGSCGGYLSIRACEEDAMSTHTARQKVEGIQLSIPFTEEV